VATYSALPELMLARSGALPTSGDYAYELKWDGFRAIVSPFMTMPLQSVPYLR
jgi:ATP-dependent DNA ligase